MEHAGSVMSTVEKEQALRERIVFHGRSLFDRGLAAGSSGNISVRLDDDGWLLTPTDSCLGQLDSSKLSKLDWQGRLISGDPPSKEAFLHRAMYEERTNANAIVHLHSTYSAAVSCIDGLDTASCLPALTPYFVMKVGRLPLIPYHRPGDPTLADAIRGLARSHAALLLANHGPIVSGVSLEAAVYATEELEETAKLFLLLRNVPIRTLTDSQIDELRSVIPLRN
jgi:ribulose-5-phosphate 4-epimerase/fuculose-1-phosphate aldolase